MPTKMQLGLGVALFVLTFGSYAILGIGFQRLNTACYNERHQGDILEPPSNRPAPGLDALLWPLFLVSIAVNDTISCSRVAHEPI
jgi:hypothetical protein